MEYSINNTPLAAFKGYIIAAFSYWKSKKSSSFFLFYRPQACERTIPAALTIGYMIGEEVNAGWVPIWN